MRLIIAFRYFLCVCVCLCRMLLLEKESLEIIRSKLEQRYLCFFRRSSWTIPYKVAGVGARARARIVFVVV